jgi:hypothetical protein
MRTRRWTLPPRALSGKRGIRRVRAGAEPYRSGRCRDLNVGLYAIDLPAPVLVFSDATMQDRIAGLRDQGYRFTSACRELWQWGRHARGT